jgi:hypothetical protein
MAEVFSISGAPVGGGGMGSFWNFAQRMAPPPPPPPPSYGPPPPPPPPGYIPPWLRTARRGAGHWGTRGRHHGRHHRRAHLFGEFGASCPPGWVQTPHGNCGGPTPPAYMNPLATNLQNALRALGRAVGGDAQLLAVSADGVIGPSTTAAVNRAFTTHIGPGQAGGVPRTGTITMFDVAAQIGPITTAIQNETVRRGGALSPPKTGGGGGGAPYVPPPSGGGGPIQADMTPGIPMTTWAIVGVVAIAAAAGGYMLLKGGGGGGGQTYSVRAGKRYAVV